MLDSVRFAIAPLMPATVLEYETSRTLLHRAALRAAGIVDPWSWLVECTSERYDERGVIAWVDLLACDRSGTLRLVRFSAGTTPDDVAPAERLRLALDASVVSAVLERLGRHITKMEIHWVFDDGGYIEERHQLEFHGRLLERAWCLMRANFLSEATTAQIAALWLRGSKN
jgi:hypothetical protein